MLQIKRLLIIALIIPFWISCNNNPRTKIPSTGSFGENFTADSAITVSNLEHLLDSVKTAQVNVSGKITDFCKGEGCWLTLQNEGHEPVTVEVEKKAFILPLNIAGKTAVVHGTAEKKADEKGAPSIVIEAKGIIIK